MHVEKYLLAIDFDMTMTVTHRMSRSWGDRIAKKLKRLKELYPIEIFILSMANMAHIFHTILMSGSSQLLLVLMDTLMITNESKNIARINYDWGEDKKTMNKMIRTIIHTDDNNNNQNLDYIIAYKKTNFLIKKSKEEDIPHYHVFFLDDNSCNIRFAHYYGFNAIHVDNHDKQNNIFQQLDRIERFMKNQLHHT